MSLGVLCLCAFTASVDITITNVALPFVSADLKASTVDLQWVIDSYNIMLAGLVVLGGGLADRVGRKTVFLGGFALFGLACLLAALSSSSDELIAARALMGVGAAGVVAPALAIVATLYGPDERARAIGVWAVFGAAGLAVGPVAGGFLLNEFWWGSVFLVNVPVVAIGVLLGARAIPQSSEPAKGPLDAAGAVLSVLGLGALLFGIIEGPKRGWTAPEVLFALAAGVVLAAAFIRRELRARAPLFDVRILLRPVVAAGAATLFASYVVFTGLLFLLPQYLQESRDQSIISVGLLLVPFAAMFGCASTQSGRVMDRFGARTTITAGLGVCSLGMASLALSVDRSLILTLLRQCHRRHRAVRPHRSGFDGRDERPSRGRGRRWLVPEHGQPLRRRRPGSGGRGLRLRVGVLVRPGQLRRVAVTVTGRHRPRLDIRRHDRRRTARHS